MFQSVAADGATGQALARVLALAFMLSQILALAWYVYSVRPPRRWRTTTGSVVRSWVAQEQYRDTHHYTAMVEYTYEAGGRNYTSSHFWAIQHYGEHSSIAERTASEYWPGKLVKVLYDPERPEEAVVETLAAGPAVVMCLFAMFFDAMTLFASFVSAQDWSTQNSREFLAIVAVVNAIAIVGGVYLTIKRKVYTGDD